MILCLEVSVLGWEFAFKSLKALSGSKKRKNIVVSCAFLECFFVLCIPISEKYIKKQKKELDMLISIWLGVLNMIDHIE